jgi:hypothetical protein
MAKSVESSSEHSFMRVLSSHLKALPFKTTLRGYHILVKTDKLHERVRFIFLSQLQEDYEVFVVGLKTYEYLKDCAIVANRRLVYLQYIDTTGFFKPREQQSQLTRCLIKAYLEYIIELRYFHRIHITARSQPEYLFKWSERNSLKSALSDIDLIRWWARTLSEFQSISSGHWVLPCFDVNLSPLYRQLMMQFSACSKWKEGYPYIMTNTASEQIPRFPDDPLSRHLEENDSGTMTTEEFSKTLSLRDEFFNRCTALFFLNLETSSLNLSAADEKHEKTIDPSYIETFQQPFDTMNHASLATQHKVTEFQKMECECIVIDIDNPSSTTKRSTDHELISSFKISNLQNRIKRKPL